MEDAVRLWADECIDDDECVDRPELWRRALAEGVGSGFLVAIVVGSGIAAERLSPGDTGLQLLENALATAAGLAALILSLAGVSGAHFNPVVTLLDAAFGGLSAREVVAYVIAQIGGASIGCVAANLMFSEPAVALSETSRASGGLWFAEVVATVGLLLVIFGSTRGGRASAVPFAVGAYIGAAYFFTASTSFANPAVTIARAFTDTFAGIAPGSVAAFVVAQLAGAGAGLALIRALYPSTTEKAEVRS